MSLCLYEANRHPPFGYEIRDFADTVALIELMDLVITVDTGGGALGRRNGEAGVDFCCRSILTGAGCWTVKDSPWYPTARLFRQSLGR
jgi:hypothetical protein